MTFPALSRIPAATPGIRSLALLQIEMFAELFEGASAAQARGFLLRIGARLAALSPLPADAESAEVLTAAMNALWDALDWGAATIVLDEDGIDIVHAGMPLTLTGDEAGTWQAGALCILEGAYDSWFRAMGSSPELTTRVIHHAAGRIELRHGL